MHQARFFQLAQDGDDATGAVHVFHVVLLGGGRHLAELRHLAGHAVDVGHGEVDARLLGCRQQVQHGIGGAAHGDVERHGILERRLGGDVARQGTRIILFIPALGQGHDALARQLEQLLAVAMGRQQRTVARLGEAQGLGQTVHGVGGKHTGAGATGGAGAALHLFALGV